MKLIQVIMMRWISSFLAQPLESLTHCRQMCTLEEVGMGELLEERWNFIYGLIRHKVFTIMPYYGVLKRSCKLPLKSFLYHTSASTCRRCVHVQSNFLHLLCACLRNLKENWWEEGKRNVGSSRENRGIRWRGCANYWKVSCHQNFVANMHTTQAKFHINMILSTALYFYT